MAHATQRQRRRMCWCCEAQCNQSYLTTAVSGAVLYIRRGYYQRRSFVPRTRPLQQKLASRTSAISKRATTLDRVQFWQYARAPAEPQS
ncbi:hypothetical protein PMIN02_012531 [Paraphaeosphaeria minitans]